MSNSEVQFPIIKKREKKHMRKKLLGVLFEKITRLKSFQMQYGIDEYNEDASQVKKAVILRLKPWDQITKDFVKQYS